MALVRYPAKGAGGGGGGSNVTSFTYTYGTETATIATDQPATFNATIPMVDINQTYFVDPTYGNDGTAVAGSMSLKYQNIGTALILASAFTNSRVFLMPGNHSMTSSISVTEVLNIEMAPGATLIVNAGGPAFNISPPQKLYITGEGQIQLVSTLFANSSPATSTLPEVVIRAKSLDGSGATDIGDITSMLFSIEVDAINDLRLSGSGYSKGYVAADFWQSSAGGQIRLSDFTAFDGETKYQENGPQEITIKGRTRARCKFFSGQSLSGGVFTERGVAPYKTKINLYVDYDTTDCLGFIDPGRGIIRHWGDLIHRKTDTAGNEMPWFYMSQDIDSDEFKPTFEHVEGDYVSGTNEVFSGSQNNEIVSILKLCNIILNGRYQNSGENTGSGAWPIVYMGNQNINPGESSVIFNGEFKSLGGDVSPIRYVDASNPNHTFKIINKTSAIQTRATYTIDTNVAFRLYVYHSLCMNLNYNPLISDGLSEDRTIVDENITVDVPEYGT